MVKRKAVSQTKARATRRKTGPSFKAKTKGKPAEVLLSQLMERYLVDADSAASFVGILSGLGMNDHNTTWRNEWRGMEKEGLIEQVEGGGPLFTSDFCLTEKGRDEASTDELKQVMKVNNAAGGNKPETNEEFHKQIKSKLMNERGEQIFDLLLKHGSLTRKELAKHLGIADTGAYFSYALQQLKDLGYAENFSAEGCRGKKVRLTDASFIKPPSKEGKSQAEDTGEQTEK